MPAHTDRIIVLVDMDCFYCQVEENLNPQIKGKPIAVVQYNQWRGGGIIAVNYPARDRGVTRHMRGKEATEKCPEINLVSVPTLRGKADLTKYREAGKRVAEVLQTFTPLLERASVDEAYMDITEAVNRRISMIKDVKITTDSLKNTHIVGCSTQNFLHNIYSSELSNDSNLKLAFGGAIVEEIREAVFEKTGYRCSAGIAHNKILAKLVCGLHKPNQQTILPQEAVAELYKDLPIKKIKSLGGKFGNYLSEDLNITNMGELINFSERDLQRKFDEKTGSWLYNIARGIDLEPVTTRLVSKSIGCCKKFPGKTALKTIEDVTHWLSELATEISERLEQDIEENNRRAKQMVLSFAQPVNRKNIHSSKTLALNSYESKRISCDAFETLKKLAQKANGNFNLTFLGISVGKFEDIKNQNDIKTFFKNCNKTINKPIENPLNIEKNKQDDFINLSEIEEDAMEGNTDLNINETIKDIQNIKSILDDDDDDYSNSTVELDYSEQLKTKEEFPNFVDTPVILTDTTKSFFMKYLKNNITTEQKQTTQEIVQEIPILPSCSNYINENNNIEEILTSPEPEDQDTKTCEECKKIINKSDYLPHLDFHLAEKLMAEERQIFQSEFQAKKKQIISSKPNSKPDKKSTHNSKSLKRKSKETCKNGTSIASFFTRENSGENNSETKLCSECNKQISVDGYACHLDYHAAKKLHLELNPVKTSNLTENKQNITVNKCKKPVNNVKSISNFFKTVPN